MKRTDATSATTTLRRPLRAGGGGRAGELSEQPLQLLSVHETTAALGISPRLLYSLTARGELPAVRIGRMKRYSRADVEAFIARHRQIGGAA